MVAPPGGTWWWLSPHWDGDSSRGNLVGDPTTGVLFPAHPCRDVLVGFRGVLDVTGGVEGGGGGHLLVPKKGHARDLWDNSGHEGHTSPTFASIRPSTARIKGIQLKIPYTRCRGAPGLGTAPSCPQECWSGGQELGRLGPASCPPEAERLQREFAQRVSYWNIFTQMLIFILPPIGRATVPKEPKANTLFLEKSSFTGAIPFEIPHSSSPWKPRESRETAPPGPTIRALKRATLRERGLEVADFPSLDTSWPGSTMVEMATVSF